jgi:hypothetical protein
MKPLGAPHVRVVHMHNTLAFFDAKEHISVSFHGVPPVCIIYAHWLFLLSSLTPNDPERSKEHTKLVGAPIF